MHDIFRLESISHAKGIKLIREIIFTSLHKIFEFSGDTNLSMVRVSAKIPHVVKT